MMSFCFQNITCQITEPDIVYYCFNAVTSMKSKWNSGEAQEAVRIFIRGDSYCVSLLPLHRERVGLLVFGYRHLHGLI